MVNLIGSSRRQYVMSNIRHETTANHLGYCGVVSRREKIDRKRGKKSTVAEVVQHMFGDALAQFVHVFLVEFAAPGRDGGRHRERTIGPGRQCNWRRHKRLGSHAHATPPSSSSTAGEAGGGLWPWKGDVWDGLLQLACRHPREGATGTAGGREGEGLPLSKAPAPDSDDPAPSGPQ